MRLHLLQHPGKREIRKPGLVVSPADVRVDTGEPHLLDALARLQAQQVLDYDDLLLYWAQMVSEPALAREVGERFSHVLVDEYQDTNRLQAAILLAMKPDGRGLTVVGDDAQSIYSFRGADIRNILDFPGHFDPPARQVTLDRNYRSTQPILAAANAVIALAAERFAKNLWSERASAQRPRLVTVKDEAAQADFVVDSVLARREEGLKLKQQAVLFRASAHSARLELELTRRNIPFVKYGGLRFLEAAHVKDVLALLRWAENPRDRIAGFRAIQLLAGIGPRTAGRVLDNVCSAPPGCVLLAEQPVPEAARPGWLEFATLVDRLSGREEASTAAFAPGGTPARTTAPVHAEGLAGGARGGLPWPTDFELACRWYEAQMPRLYDDFQVRVLDIQQLARIAATSPPVIRVKARRSAVRPPFFASTSGPMTAANATGEARPKAAIATAMASSKLLEAAVKESEVARG